MFRRSDRPAGAIFLPVEGYAETGTGESGGGPPGERVRRWSTATFLALFLLAFLLLWKVVRPYVLVIALALFITVVLGPVHEKLVRFLGGRRSLASALAVFGTVLLVLTPTAYFIFRLVQESGPAIEAASRWLGPAGIPGLLQGHLPPGLSSFLDRLPIENLDNRLREALQRTSKWIGGAAAAVPALGAELFTDTFVFLASLYAFFLRGPALARSVVEIVPMHRRYTRDLLGGLAQGMRSLIAAKFLTAVIQGFIGFIGFKIVGMPFAIGLSALMAFASFVFSLIPLLGTGMVWVPASVWLFLTGHPWSALFLLAWGFLVIGTVDNFVNPLFTQGALQLPASVVLVTIFGGITAFGPLGALFGPLIGSLFGAFLRIWRQDFLPEVIGRNDTAGPVEEPSRPDGDGESLVD